jgi:hypothetical protein
MHNLDEILADLPARTRKAVAFYWKTRNQQKRKQVAKGGRDQGSRSAVIGGAQIDSFSELITVC